MASIFTISRVRHSGKVVICVTGMTNAGIFAGVAQEWETIHEALCLLQIGHYVIL